MTHASEAAMSPIPPAAFGRPALALWPLDPALLYLNHGTVGVTPRAVLAAQQRIRDEIEREPARFQLRELATGQPGAIHRRSADGWELGQGLTGLPPPWPPPLPPPPPPPPTTAISR